MITYEQISTRAYHLWEADGCKPGAEWAYWFKAEQQLKREAEETLMLKHRDRIEKLKGIDPFGKGLQDASRYPSLRECECTSCQVEKNRDFKPSPPVAELPKGRWAKVKEFFSDLWKVART